MRVLAMRTLLMIDVVLEKADAERVAEVLGEWLPHVRPPSERERNVWAALGADDAVRVLARALPRSSSERVRAALGELKYAKTRQAITNPGGYLSGIVKQMEMGL